MRRWWLSNSMMLSQVTLPTICCWVNIILAEDDPWISNLKLNEIMCGDKVEGLFKR